MRALIRPRHCLLSLGLVALTACDAVSIEDLPGLAAMCIDEAGTNCPCSGVLIAPDVVASARHCGNIPWVIVGREDPSDTTTGMAVRTAGRCGGMLADPDCASLVTMADLDIYHLQSEIPADISTPVRLSSAEDRVAGANYIAAGRSPGPFRFVQMGAPRSCVVDGFDHGGSFDGVNLCFDAVTPPVGTPPLDGGDSGGPLYIVGTDGELAVTGVVVGGEGGLDIFTDIHPYKQYLPAVSRPPFFIDPDFLLNWRRQCVWPLPEGLVLYPLSTRSADFDGDGNEEGFFESDKGVPYLLLDPEQVLLDTAPLADAETYPFSNLAADLIPGGGVEMATLDLQGTLHVASLSQVSWSPTSLPTFDLPQLDPFWGGADLSSLFAAQRFAADPLLRAGDFDGDGRPDILASGEENLVLLRNGVQTWFPSAVALKDLGVPNAANYRETLTIADVDVNHPGDEIIVRRECGLAVFGFDPQLGWTELFDQACGGSPWVASDANGYHEDNRWRIAAGNLNGDACADLIVRSESEVYQLFASCNANEALSLLPGPATGMFFRGPIATYPGWNEGLEGSLRLADIDGDGLDDLTANSPYGIRVHINQNDAQLPFASVGGLDPEFAAAALPHLEIDSWGWLADGRFDGVHREYISYSTSLACFERFWLFD